MAIDGTRSLDTFNTISAATISVQNPVNVPTPTNLSCCEDCSLLVLADNTGNATSNDISTVIWWFNTTTTAAVLTLQKVVSGAWVTKKTISDNTYGTYNAYGFYTNSENQNFVSFKINWANVLNDSSLGAGAYRVVCTYTDPIFGNGTVNSYIFCLKPYTPQIADGTVRLEYTLSGTTADITNDTLVKDYGTLEVYNQIRVNGYFGYAKTPYVSEYVETVLGQQLFVEDRANIQYECELLMLPEWIHAILRIDFMMADSLAITDYNSMNNASYVTKYVIKDSEYSPNYYQLQSMNAPVQLKFKPANNRTRKFRS